ncbi:ABC transporter substrate-binding protein [Micromonospora sp. NPDC048830]|uniref:ABC transporter substrate-binding protein n=1 Tax=Micromonospora sp. NPDC048830 TaxID=3364257 RepID=UPI00371A91B9
MSISRFAGMRRVAAVAAVLAMTGGMAACGPDDSAGAGGVLKVRIAGAMNSSDPFKEIGSNSWQLLRQVYEGLVSLDDDYNPIPMLAKSWTVSEDQKVYTFVLRDDVTFHNGKKMTSADVVYSLDYYRQNATRASQLANIKSVTAAGEHSVVVTLSAPQANFLALLGQPIEIVIVPAGAADNKGLVNSPVGTGPFKVDNFDNENRVVLKKFDGYVPVDAPASFFGGRKEARVDTVVIESVPEDQTALAGIETHQYDVAIEVPVQDLDRISAVSGVKVESTNGTNTHAAYVNTADPVLKDVKVRQAIAAAIDRKKLLDTTVKGQGEVANSYVSNLVSWFDPTADDYWPYTGGVAQAKSLLAESSYQGQKIEIIAGAPANQKTNATLIAQMLQDAGFTVAVQTLDHATYQSRLNAGKFQLAATGTPLRTPADLLYNEWYCGDDGKPGRFGYCDAGYDATYRQATQTADETKRNALFAQLEKKLKDEAVIMPWYWQKSVWAVSDKVSGARVAPSGLFSAWNVSLTQ